MPRAMRRNTFRRAESAYIAQRPLGLLRLYGEEAVPVKGAVEFVDVDGGAGWRVGLGGKDSGWARPINRIEADRILLLLGVVIMMLGGVEMV